MKKSFFVCCSMLLVFSCNTNPLTAEQVAQQWVEAYYKSAFDDAKALSTEITKVMIDSIAPQLIDEEDLLPFQIKQMTCEVNGDSALCTYIFKDELEELEELVHLVAVDGHWLVNEPLVDDAEIEKELEKYFEEFEQLLNNELENLKEDE